VETEFELIGQIRAIETIATGRGIQIIERLIVRMSPTTIIGGSRPSF